MSSGKATDEFVEIFEAALRAVVGPIRSISASGWVVARLAPFAHKAEIRLDQVRDLLTRSAHLSAAQIDDVVKRLSTELSRRTPVEQPPRVIAIDTEHDVVLARGEAKKIAQDVGFDATDTVKIATVVSELARNIVLYAKNGRIEVERLGAPQVGIAIVASDNGPGIVNLDQVLSGKYRSKSGMGLGLLGSKRLVDEFNVESIPGRGTKVSVRKYLGRSR